MTRVDIDFNFRPHPLTGDITLKKGSSAIVQSLKNIVLTSFYERGFNVVFGTNVRSSLFELYSPLDLLTMKQFIIEAINIHEPDVEIYDVVVQSAIEDENSIEIIIQYTEYNSPDIRDVQIKLERTQ